MLEETLAELAEDYELTVIEQQSILLNILGELNKFALRYERHGDYETPSGETRDETEDS